MFIRKITIPSFGKLRNQEMEFSPGINVLYGENESGKTTLHTFIRSMFYGMTRQRGRGARTDTYATYEPWEEPAAYGGILWFENGEKEFRLSRGFHRSSPGEELVCMDDGEILNISQGDLDAVLGDISEVVYDNTVSVAQLKSVTGQDLIRELQNYMASYQGTGDSSVDLGRTMQMLKMMRKGYQVQKERREKELSAWQEKLDTQMGYLKLEMEKLESRLSEDEEEKKKQKAEGHKEMILEALEDIRRSEKRGAVLLWLTILLTLSGSISGILWLPVPWLAGLILLAGAGTALWEFSRIRRLASEGQRLKKLLFKYRQKQKKTDWEMENRKEEYAERETAYKNLQNEYLEQELTASEKTAWETEIQALNLAMSTISTLSDRFHSQVGDRLRARTSQILSEITGGKYREVLLDQEFHMTVNTRERLVALESLSRGTLEQIYFALRMAAGELLCGEETFPVILDDVFGMYDEERLSAVLHWLEGQNRQIIISTCSRRESEILDKEGIPYRLLELES